MTWPGHLRNLLAEWQAQTDTMSMQPIVASAFVLWRQQCRQGPLPGQPSTGMHAAIKRELGLCCMLITAYRDHEAEP